MGGITLNGVLLDYQDQEEFSLNFQASFASNFSLNISIYNNYPPLANLLSLL